MEISHGLVSKCSTALPAYIAATQPLPLNIKCKNWHVALTNVTGMLAGPVVQWCLQVQWCCRSSGAAGPVV
jgi:hypothetical protein